MEWLVFLIVLIVLGCLMWLWEALKVVMPVASVLIVAALVAFWLWDWWNTTEQARIAKLEEAERLEEQARFREEHEEGLRVLEEQERILEEEARVLEYEEAERVISQLADLQADLLADHLIIDSNVWMNQDYEIFFSFVQATLAASRSTALLIGQQFDEICNLKRAGVAARDSRERSRESEGVFTKKGSKARTAIARIEAFQAAGLLHIESMTVNAERGAYADPLILRKVIELSREPVTVTLISDDKELRIRARSLAASDGAKTKVLHVQPLAVAMTEWSVNEFFRRRNAM